MSRTKEESCPVGGCDYKGSKARVRLHVERKRDEAHKAHRASAGISEPSEAPTATQAEPNGGQEPHSEPASNPTPAVVASAVEVDFGTVEPVVEPLIPSEEPSPPPPARAPADEGPKGGSEPAPVVFEDEPARPAQSGFPGGLQAPASVGEAPSLGMVLLSPFLQERLNRLVLGATNTFLLDVEQGDRPLEMREVQALNVPMLTAQTLMWLEEKYGWKLTLDHPLAWWALALADFAAIVRAHRAPRPESGAPAVVEEPAAQAPVPAPAPVLREEVPEDPMIQQMRQVMGS